MTRKAFSSASVRSKAWALRFALHIKDCGRRERALIQLGRQGASGVERITPKFSGSCPEARVVFAPDDLRELRTTLKCSTPDPGLVEDAAISEEALRFFRDGKFDAFLESRARKLSDWEAVIVRSLGLEPDWVRSIS